MYLMDEVRNYLGVRVDEEFQLQPVYKENEVVTCGPPLPCTFKFFRKEGLFRKYELSDKWESAKDYLQPILMDELRVVDTEFHPANGKPYWVVCWSGCMSIPYVVCRHWWGALKDYMYLRSGNFFSTKLEAEKEKFNIVKQIVKEGYDIRPEDEEKYSYREGVEI